MKRINFNIKDRKFLITTLSLAIVCIFTLTIAYSALSAVLTINGNARVSAADWDIYLANPKVTNGSATTNLPVIKTSSTLEFSTTLNMPGDFYEFVVDVVNGGDIDAMIENVVKTPDLTAEQAKFLKYEITYQNNEPITTKQLLAKNTSMPIKVRIEYRKDLNNSDLPTNQVVLDFALTLEYIQSDGTGSSVNNSGMKVVNVVSGDGTQTGDEVCIGEECFYVMYCDDTSVTMLAKYNLLVGNKYDKTNKTVPLENPTGVQDETARGWFKEYSVENPIIGVIPFSSNAYWSSITSTYPAYVYNENSYLYEYVENYKSHLEGLGVEINEARLITLEELEELGCVRSSNSCSGSPEWIYSTSYWSGSADSSGYIWYVRGNNNFYTSIYTTINFGVRPVIIIDRSLI